MVSNSSAVSLSFAQAFSALSFPTLRGYSFQNRENSSAESTGYNPDAKEIYAEGLRIPPVKLWEKGKRREDVINFMLTNMRARPYQEGDLNAQYGACKVGERHLLELLDKYGVAQVRACIAELKNMADRLALGVGAEGFEHRNNS